MNDDTWLNYLLIGIIFVMMIRGTNRCAKYERRIAALRYLNDPKLYPPPFDYRRPVPWGSFIFGSSLIAFYILAHVFA